MQQVPESIDPAWLVAQVQAGVAPERLVATLIGSGMSEDAAIDLLTSALSSRLAELRVDDAVASPTVPVSSPVPEPLGLDWGTEIHTPDRIVQVLFSLAHPRVILFGNLLAEEECDELIELARERIEASQVIDLQTGGNRADTARTSSGMAFRRGEPGVIDRVERRIAALLRWPIDHGEALQLLRYRRGEEYRPHYDYIDPSVPGAVPFLARGGQRVASLVMYLNTPARGGGTNFPDAGIEVAARKGNAVFFSYPRPHPTTGSLHGGMPVLDGEKWVATKWLRESRHD